MQETLIILLSLSFVDFLTIARARRIKSKKTFAFDTQSQDFTILVPIFGNIKYLRNAHYLKTYGSNVVLCTTTRETKEFNKQLEEIAGIHGFKIFRSNVPLSTKASKPNPWKLFFNTLSEGYQVNKELARDEIIRDSFKVVTTKYCIFVDGDTVTEQNISLLTGEMENQGFDIASVRVLVANKSNLIEKLQSFEYEMAMEARHLYPWLTSGAGMIAKVEVMKHVMQNHSLFFSGGDIEIGKLGKMLGYKVGHLPFVFLTDVPDTLKKWFRQRMLWFGGGFRHTVVNINCFTWRTPYFFLYTTVFVYLSLPLKWYHLIQSPVILPILLLVYWMWIAVFHLNRLEKYLLLFPLYAFMQAMVVLPFGVYAYSKMAVQSKNIGLIRVRQRGIPLD